MFFTRIPWSLHPPRVSRGTMAWMRRFARRLFTLCSTVSLLLCVATGAVWARSWWAVDTFAQIRWDGGTGRHSQSGVAWERGRTTCDHGRGGGRRNSA